jgi:hypothetical protein
MAELTTCRNDVLGYPVYGLPYVVVAPLLDADGDPVVGATPDSEISLNGDTSADTASEAGEITATTAANGGNYALPLSAAEMTCDVAAIVIASATSKATSIVLYPKKLPLILSGVAGATGNDATHIHIPDGVATNDFYIGCIVFLKDHTGANQVRLITDYVGATKLATVGIAFVVTPDDTTDYGVYLTDVAVTTLIANNIIQIAGTAQTAGDLAGAIITDAAGTNIAADIIALKAETVTILADTNELQAEFVDAGRLDAILDAILADTAELQADWANAGRLDALLDVAIADIAAVHAHAATIEADTAELQAEWADAGRLDAILDAILADSNELQTDWANGGRLDLILDIIAADTTTDIPATLATIAGYIDTEVASILAAVDTEVAAILADTNELQTDWANGGRLDLILDAVGDPWLTALPGAYAAGSAGHLLGDLGAPVGASISADIAAVHAHAATIEADTNEIQVDWANGGRLDLLLDSAVAVTNATIADAVWNEVRADHVTAGTFGEVSTTADIVDAVWNELAADHVAAGSIGKAIADILADSNELQGDWVNGGRLDLLLDGAASAGDPWLTTLPGAYGAGTAGMLIGKLGAPAGASISADIAAIKGETATILADTAELQAEFVDGGRLDLLIDAILADTAELQAEWVDGGRLDLIVDAILLDTGTTLDGRIPAALVGGRMDASVGAMAANVLTATAINADAITAAKIADGAIDAATFAAGAITAAAIAADAIGASELATDAVNEIVAGVWNALTTSYGGAGTYAQAIEDILADTNDLQTWFADGGRLDLIIDAAAAAGDPWVTALPGIYAAGSAGKLIGDSLNAPVGTVDTVVDSILAMLTDIHGTDLPAVKTDTAAMPASILAAVYEGAETIQTLLRSLRATAAGASTGHDLGIPEFKSADGTKTRVKATVDANGNRSGVVVDGS